jgi:hypothetical protein
MIFIQYIYIDWCNFSNPTMRKSRTESKCEDLKSSPIRIGGWHLIQINHYLKWGELILIQSKDGINFDPVLGLDQYTEPAGIQYYHVGKIKQYGWLILKIYLWIITVMSMRFNYDVFTQLHQPYNIDISRLWSRMMQAACLGLSCMQLNLG